MISRYSREPMRSVWTEERKLSHWLEIELLACEGMASLKQIPVSDARAIRKKARFDLTSVQENEKRTQHDVLAFLENVATYVGPAGRWIHQGLTSSDLLDTTLALQLKEASDILLKELQKLLKVIASKAKKYKYTPMIGRTHGIHAEPITYGLKLALMYEEFMRAQKRLEMAREQILVGKLSGAVGTHAHLDPRIEAFVCKKLGLKPANVATQIIQRDRHAEFVSALALIGCSIERWATEFRHLQRTEVLEVEEFFAEGQKGSSAMPHKRNPILSERLCGLARLLRGYALAAMENVALWHERDISHSSAERVLLPDATLALDYMLGLLIDIVSRQLVYPENMAKNLELSCGLFASQSVLLALTQAGMQRREAYEAVQRAAMACWQRRDSFLKCVQDEPSISQYLSPQKIKELCSLKPHMAYIDLTFKKCGLL